MERRTKRAIDVVLASVGLVAASPAMAVIAIVVAVAMGRPILFRQPRPGLHGRPFVIVKFRTMTNAVDAEGRPLGTGERTTRLGYILRKTSLDELPELWNVLRGDMSLVGPRPLLMEYLPRYTPEQNRRHEVCPGITGLAQISGRHLLPWEDRFALDTWYVDHWSLALDLRILGATIRQVLTGRGIPPRGTPDDLFQGTHGAGISASVLATSDLVGPGSGATDLTVARAAIEAPADETAVPAE